MSQDSYGGEGAKMKMLQVGGGGGEAGCGQLSDIYSMCNGMKLLQTQSQSDLSSFNYQNGEQRP